MTQLDRRINEARFRLNLNHVFQHAALGVMVAAGLWSLALFMQRLLMPVADDPAKQLVLGIPFWFSVAAAGGVAVIITFVATLVRRVDPLTAAITLDKAAGLKERISTGLACRNDTDDFARAAKYDAEQAAGRITVAAHVPYRAPRRWQLSIASVMVAVALAANMPAVSLLAGVDPADKDQMPEAVKLERDAVKLAFDKKLNEIKALAKNDPEFAEAISDLEPLELPDSPNLTQEDIRRVALAGIKKVADQLRDRKNADQEDTLKQLRRMLDKMEFQQNRDSNRKLANSLAAGDFEGARKALEAMKKQLAEAAKKGDPEAMKKLAQMQKKLDAVAKQLARIANNKQLEKELQNKAGLSPEQTRELLKQLSKLDPKQLQKELQKRLAKKGLSQEQIKKLAQKIANNQKAQEMARKLAQKIAQASQSMGQMQKAGQGNSQGQNSSQAQGEAALDAAMDQLSEMEIAEQQLNELEAQLAELDDLGDDIAGGQCEGRGTKRGDKIGQQGPNEGLGRGARIGKERRAHAYKARKVKSQLRKGKIIGQILVDGPQVKGESMASAREALMSEIKDATDAINRDEIPRQYQHTAKTYFDRLAGLAGKGNSASKTGESQDAEPRP